MMIPDELSDADARIVKSITGREGQALEWPTRAFLEARFGVSVGQVRVHTGPDAAAAAARLNARAFAWGRHIVFGEGEYRPRSAEGMRLLAHELTHVIQHQDERAEGQGIPLGVPDDPREREADLAAERIGSSAPLPPIAPGGVPTLRRVVIIKAPATTGIDVITAGAFAEPSVDVGPGRNQLCFNLRRGFNSTNFGQSGPAFTFNGHVGVKLDPGDTLADFTFGFVQFMRQIAHNILYVGREDREGQIEANLLPLLGTDFLLDATAGAAFSPFAQNPAVFTTLDTTSNEVVARTGDHPNLGLPQTLSNINSGFPNFIFSVVDHREAVSVFVVRDRLARGGRSFVPLAHVHWDLFYNGTFQWRDRHPIPVVNVSSFTVDKPVKGAPTDKTITALLATLSPSTAPLFNTKSDTALKASLTPPNSRELDHRDRQIPVLFFLEGPGSLNIP